MLHLSMYVIAMVIVLCDWLSCHYNRDFAYPLAFNATVRGVSIRIFPYHLVFKTRV